MSSSLYPLDLSMVYLPGNTSLQSFDKIIHSDLFRTIQSFESASATQIHLPPAPEVTLHCQQFQINTISFFLIMRLLFAANEKAPVSRGIKKRRALSPICIYRWLAIGGACLRRSPVSSLRQRRYNQ